MKTAYSSVRGNALSMQLPEQRKQSILKINMLELYAQKYAHVGAHY